MVCNTIMQEFDSLPSFHLFKGDNMNNKVLNLINMLVNVHYTNIPKEDINAYKDIYQDTIIILDTICDLIKK